MNLYEIKQEIDLIDNYFDPETGEILEGGIEYLNGLQIERKEKILSLAKKIDLLIKEEESIKNKVKILNHRAHILSNTSERLKGYLTASLGEREKLKDEEIQISWRKSESVDICGEPENLPAEFLKFKIEVDKTELKKALKNGLQCEDAKLVEKNNLIIR